MVHLKLADFFIFVLLTGNPTDSFSCLGKDISPSELYRAKINKSLELFPKESAIKPEFLIRQTGNKCHNAWADVLANKIIISEPILKDFSAEELAGIIAHEIAHLEFPKENEHWRTDLRGAELTSTHIMLQKLNRMLSICISLKATEELSYSILYNLEWEIEDYVFRIDKIKSHQFTKSPKQIRALRF